MILSATLFLLGVFAYSLKELWAFKKFKWMSESPYEFMGEASYLRKYKNIHTEKGKFQVTAPKNNWYYNLFKIHYEEAFLGSSTIFALVTDFYHLMQFFYKLLFCSAFYPMTNWWFPVLLWCLWGILFSLANKYLTK